MVLGKHSHMWPKAMVQDCSDDCKVLLEKKHSTKDGQRPHERPGVESGDPE